MDRKTILGAVLMAILLGAGSLRAEDAVSSDSSDSTTENTSDNKDGQSPMIELVDIPTADVLDPMTYATTFRFYNNGGLTSRFILGPLKRVNLGVSFDAQRVIGSGDPHLVTPAVFFKVRPFDGNDFLPALALGYDNQGMLWQESTDEYMHREKGLYLVGSHEIFLPNLELHAGINVNKFDSDSAVYGFFGSSFKFTPNFALLMEYDNIRNGRDNRFNVGGRFWVAPYFNIDFAARNIPHGESRGGERILRLNYVGHFPI
jgi:hypothetical protein